MIKILSIIVGKLALFVLKKLNRGSAFPGTITYKINKHILRDLEKPSKVITVTGSSGKGSTTKIIAKVLRNSGYKVAYNDKGSNQIDAIITTLLENSTITGKTKVDMAVLEIDERYVKYVFKDLVPDYVVITNITRDQPPRQRHFDFIFDEINNALPDKTNLILNSDDPYLQNFALKNKYNITYYGLDKLHFSYTKNKFPVLNISRCPICQNKLSYKFYHIEQQGHYSCLSCDFKRPDAQFEMTKFNENNNTMFVNKKYQITVQNDMLFNLYNSLAAFSILALLDLDQKKIAKIISSMNTDEKIFDRYKQNNRDIFVLNNKNENAATFNQSVLYASLSNKPKTIVIGWREISRRYEFDDLSWLYDIEFELLNNENTKEIIVAGPQRYDIATRLKYAKVPKDKVKIFYDLNMARDTINNAKGDIYAIVNFDYIMPFNKIMEVKNEN